jgi:hypothetical protein
VYRKPDALIAEQGNVNWHLKYPWLAVGPHPRGFRYQCIDLYRAAGDGPFSALTARSALWNAEPVYDVGPDPRLWAIGPQLVATASVPNGRKFSSSSMTTCTESMITCRICGFSPQPQQRTSDRDPMLIGD